MREQLSATPRLGLGLGWRPELAWHIERRSDLGFVEVVAENLGGQPLPLALRRLRERGVAIVPHGIGLSLGGEVPPDPARLAALARLAEECGAPLVSEHVCFVRAGGLESGHLLPIARTRRALDRLVAHVEIAQRALPVPLALENIATLFEWPGAELSEPELLAELAARTGAWLLLDVANLHANARNLGWDPLAYLDAFPLDRVAYAHVAGGLEREGVYHDTHAHPVPRGAYDLLGEVTARVALPGAMIERDDHYPPEEELDRELDAVAAILESPVSSLPKRALRATSAPSDPPWSSGPASQDALLAALWRLGPVPGGFDRAQVERAGAALASKRARTVASVLPPLEAALGDRFGRTFDAYGRELRLPASPEADALAFARWCAGRGPLPPDAMRAWLALELRGRRWAAVRAGARRVLAVRAPWVGLRWIEIAA